MTAAGFTAAIALGYSVGYEVRHRTNDRRWRYFGIALWLLAASLL